MIILAPGNTLAADADMAANVTITVFGMELLAGVETYKVLYQGQMAATPTVIYTAPASTQVFIRSISIVNIDSTASHTARLFVGGTSDANAITPIYKLAVNGVINYEDGQGWNNAVIVTGNALLNDVHSGYSEYDAISDPSTPDSAKIRIYAKLVSGRMVPKWMPPSGVDTPIQAALYGNNIVMYVPNTGTTAGINVGAPWTVGTTIGHPQPTAGMYTQIKRTTSINVITTTNQALGVSSIVSTAAQFWIGNSAGLGGFFFFARFGIEKLTAASPNATRLFVGLMSGTTNILVSDTVPAISCIGLWHDTTDGANVLNVLTKDGVTAVKNPLNGTPTTPYVTGQGYDFYMYCKPADNVIYYRLNNINLNTVLSEGSITSNLPNPATFMGPVCGMSNGTSNIVASTVGIGVNRIYIESDR